MLVQVKGSKKIQADAIFFQPTRYCALNCKGCYVKEHLKTDKITPAVQQGQLIRALCESDKAEVNQITMSVDHLPPSREGSAHKRFHMTSVFQAFLFIANDPGVTTRPEMHITVKGLGSLQTYMSELRMHDKELSGLDFISLSEIPVTSTGIASFDALRTRIPNTKFGWNVMIPGKELNDAKYLTFLAAMDAIMPSLDQIYLLLRKTPIGTRRTLETVKKDKEQMTRDLQFIEDVKETAERRGYGHKVLVDGCLQDVVKFKETGFGCSANISKFQIWPDGSVSGCPYKYKAVTGPGETWQEIFLNIRKAQYFYDFQECHLPEIYDVTRVL